MERHEHFEGLLAAASLGEAQGGDLVQLQEHLSECASCRDAYADFLQLGSVRMVREANEQQEVSGAEAIGYIDSGLFREKVLRKAEAEGILAPRGQAPRGQQRVPLPHAVLRPTPHQNYGRFALAMAASVLLAMGSLTVYHSRERFFPSKALSAGEPVKGQTPQISTTAQAEERRPADEKRGALIAQLQSEKVRLNADIAELKGSLAKEVSAREELESNAANSAANSAANLEAQRVRLIAATKSRDARIDELEQQLSQAQAQVASVQSELATAQASNVATVAADQARIQELSDQLADKTNALDREREMLAANRDIRDLMSARNLHIADVFDTDTKGKTRTAFGRVFFTEGKSLIIYAYDLNDRRVEEAGYHYRVWGKKETPGAGARSLGIFYSDDKVQKRWVFKCEDPKMLSEIDSVFVTLEPPGKEPTSPKGEKFLYAYLRNQPNHP